MSKYYILEEGLEVSSSPGLRERSMELSLPWAKPILLPSFSTRSVCFYLFSFLFKLVFQFLF